MRSSKSNRGIIKATLAVGLLVGGSLVAGTFFFGGSRGETTSPAGMLTFEVIRGEFVSSITESGDVESSINEEIRCRVRERGGTAIVKIVPEGTMVKKDDFLIQLDDSSLQDELVEQKIRVATDTASVIQAQSDLDTAMQTLEEFESGVYGQELSTYQAEQAFAQENLRRAKDYQRYSENLALKGYVTKAQLEADRFAVVKAQKELDLAESKLTVFEKHTRERMLKELNAEIEKQKANLEAAQFTKELSMLRLDYYQKQVNSCKILAPSDGQVVYANEIERGDNAIIIEEGVNVREGQLLIRLPDPTKMQVTTKVNDSKINSVAKGQSAIIRLDTAPETPIRGIVSKVAAFPEPRRWSQAPIEYEVFVEVSEKHEMVRPGLRAKVEIFVEKISNVLQAPVSAVINQNDSYYVLVQNDNDLELRPIDIGPNNESVVVVKGGLNPGERVLLDPERFQDELDQGNDS